MTTRLLQVLPSVVRTIDGNLQVEADFSESLRLYAKAFDSITIACPVTTELGDFGLKRCRPLRDLAFRDQIRVAPLPNAYDLLRFIRHYPASRRLLRQEIMKADCLLFSPHSLFGDWPTVAVAEAIKQRRSYVIDADVVYHQVAKVDWRRLGVMRRFVKEAMLSPLFERSYRRCLRHAGMTILQGQDVFDAYSAYCANPHKALHTPVSSRDYITDKQLRDKLLAIRQGHPLKLCYVGRCVPMKGPNEWLAAIHHVITQGVEISAVWLGDGSLLPAMRAAVAQKDLSDRVQFRGYIADRDEVFSVLRSSDLFVFCHQTPESPRCLVEALASGCPLIGYDSAYPRELVARHGGGRFSQSGDWRSLATLISELARNREELCKLILSASASGRQFDRDTAMQERIDLILNYRSAEAARWPSAPRSYPERRI